MAIGAGGLMMGWALVSPGNHKRTDALVIATRRAFTLLLGLGPLLVVAGTIEGNISPSDTPFPIKLAIGLSTGALFYSYLLLAGRRHGARAQGAPLPAGRAQGAPLVKAARVP
jgi:stage II sporulation SpoM-like protein